MSNLLERWNDIFEIKGKSNNWGQVSAKKEDLNPLFNEALAEIKRLKEIIHTLGNIGLSHAKANNHIAELEKDINMHKDEISGLGADCVNQALRIAELESAGKQIKEKIPKIIKSQEQCELIFSDIYLIISQALSKEATDE